MWRSGLHLLQWAAERNHSRTGDRAVREWIEREADELLPELIEWRRDFHRNPELGFEEVRTAGVVAAHLQEQGLEVSTGVGKTGVIAMVEPDGLEERYCCVLTWTLFRSMRRRGCPSRRRTRA